MFIWAHGYWSEGALTTVAVEWEKLDFRHTVTLPEIDLSGQDSLLAFIVLKLNYSLSYSSTCLKCLIKPWEKCQYCSTSKSLTIVILHIACSWGHVLSDFSQAGQGCGRKGWAFPRVLQCGDHPLRGRCGGLARGSQLTKEYTKKLA